MHYVDMWTPEHIEATFFLLVVFVTLFLGVAFSIQCLTSGASEKLVSCCISGIFLLVSLSLIIYYFY